MALRHNPGFVGNARGVRAQRDKVTTHLQHTLVLAKFLRNDVAENAAFLLLEVIAPGAQLVEHTTRHESGRSELGCGMFEFLPGTGSVIFEDADVLEAPV